MAKATKKPKQAEISPELWEQVKDLCNTLTISVCAIQSLVKQKLKISDAEWQETFNSARDGLDELHAKPKKTPAKRAAKSPPSH